MARLTLKQRTLLKKIALCFLSLGGIVVITRIALHLGEIVNPTTVGFSFLILVVTSAIFGGLAVAVIISIVATLFFNYFFLPPIGTFVIYDFHNWVALFAFLLTSVVISRLTASANENRHKADDLEFTLGRLKEFGTWLLSTPSQQITLSGIAEAAVRIFSLQYCSIHVYAEGKWHHFTGTSVGKLSQEIADKLKMAEDHPTDLVELAEEQGLGVRYSRIRTGEDAIGLLVVKSEYLTPNASDSIAAMIGMVLAECLRDTHLTH
jgi:two-component system, OmpR family, sensor histidine kinase KdpD